MLSIIHGVYSGCVGLYVVVYIMVYTCCQYVNFVWITWCMLGMLSVCLVYVGCAHVCSVYVLYVGCAWCMLNMHYVCSVYTLV